MHLRGLHETDADVHHCVARNDQPRPFSWSEKLILGFGQFHLAINCNRAAVTALRHAADAGCR